MPLYIRDDGVDLLASELRDLSGARSKTEAVRSPLTHEIRRIRDQRPVRERLAEAVALARQIGPSRGEFDMKAFTGDLWGG